MIRINFGTLLANPDHFTWTTFTKDLNPTSFGCSAGGCVASDYRESMGRERLEPVPGEILQWLDRWQQRHHGKFLPQGRRAEMGPRL